jgi:hypothetical protein
MSVTKESSQRLLQAARRIVSDLKASLVWNMLQDEPTIVEFVAAMDAFEQELNQNESQM